LQGGIHARDTILSSLIFPSFAMLRIALILAALLAASCLAACGQKGPLKLPPDPPKAVAGTSAR
jgi:hypothetical protein